MTKLLWDELLTRQDLAGGELELRLDQYVLRGPITSIDKTWRIVIGFAWQARRAGDSDDDWQAWGIGGSFCFGPEQWPVIDLSDECVIFASQMEEYRDRFWGKIYPAGQSQLDPAAVAGLPWPVEDRSKWTFPRVEMSETDWDAICGGEDSDDEDEDPDDRYPALPSCCANISALRGEICAIRQQGGYLWPSNQDQLPVLYQHVVGGHDFDTTVLERLMVQVR